MTRATNVAKFIEVYGPALAECAAKSAYPWYNGDPACVRPVLDRMHDAFIRGSYNHSSDAIKLACKRLQLRHTRKALEAFFNAAD